MTTTSNQHSRPFVKMQGLGNDFAIFDARESPLVLGAETVRQIADRRDGIGCDQVILLEPSERADVRMRIYNADGGESGACGNASRCVARLMGLSADGSVISIETGDRILTCQSGSGGNVRVNMGAAKFDWTDIPLAEERDTMAVRIDGLDLPPAIAVNVGNPHAVLFVEDTTLIDLSAVGPRVESHPLFPEKVNLGLARIESRDRIALKVWERGAGRTRACGTGAVAAFAAARRKGWVNVRADICLPGGTLNLEEDECGDIWMTGPAAIGYTGIIELPVGETSGTEE